MLTASVETSVAKFEAFAFWLYTGKTPEFDRNPENLNIGPVFAAHAVGRDLGSVAFMDVILDIAIDLTFNAAEHLSIAQILEPFGGEFPRYSGGRKFAMDFVLLYPHLGENKVSKDDYKDVYSIGDTEMVKDMCCAVSKAKGVVLAEDTVDPEYATMLLAGFLAEKSFHEPLVYREYPWQTDKCRYHRHTELGLPCYSNQYRS